MSKPNTYFVRKFDIQFSLYLFQAPSNSVETPPETLKKLVEEGKEQVSISPILYEELLHVQIPKAQKIQSSHQSFCAFGLCQRKSFA